MSPQRNISRRRFLGELSCSAVGAASLLSSLSSLKLMGAGVHAGSDEPSDYKALVCLFLAGGNDSFNMLVPRQSTAYQEYAAVRDNLALSETSLLPITSAGQPYAEFGIHPAMTNLKSLYDDGNAAFVANVGSLIRPTTLADFQAGLNIPSGLFSHSDEQFHWQTIVPQVRGGGPGGWGGRIADLMAHVNAGSPLSMNISLSGINTFQTGGSTVQFVADASGAPEIQAFDDPVEKVAVQTMLEENYRSLYEATYSSSTTTTFDKTVQFAEAIEPVEITSPFTGRLGSQLRMIARCMAARENLGMKRQIFFVLRGGWDHHTEVLNNQNGLLGEIDTALGEFWACLGDLGLQDAVTLFSASDFGRTLTSNGRGSDHAWGGNTMVMGGAVNGGRIYGQYPELGLGNALDTGRGRLIPTTAVDLYCTELASWFGVPAGEMATILPNVSNFINPVSNPYPLGFLG